MAEEAKSGAPEKTGAPEAKVKAKAERREAYVVGAESSVMVDGEAYAPGATVQLTDEQALSLEGKVSLASAQVQADGPPKAGKYVVTEHGSICRGGRFFNTGDVLDCSAAEAKEWSDRLKPAP
jgi:hypothetical protein